MKLSIMGMGIVSPVGIGKNNFYESLANGRTGIVDYEKNIFRKKAGEVSNFKVKQFTKNFKQARPLAKASHFGLSAAKMALDDAHYNISLENQDHTAVILGTNNQSDDSNSVSIQKAYKVSLDDQNEINSQQFSRYGMLQFPAKYLLQIVANIPTFTCGYELAAHGYSNTILSGSNSFFDSLIETDIVLKQKIAQAVFCGATDSLLNPIDIINLVPCGAKKCEDCTIIPGEGAVFFLLEESRSVTGRNTKEYGEILSCIGALLQNNEDIITNINNTLIQAQLTVDDIDVIVGSQGGRPFYSQSVLEAFGKCFKEKREAIPLSSPLPYLGYTRAVAGGFDLAFAIYILETGQVPPALTPAQSFGSSFYAGNNLKKAAKTVLIVSIGLTGCIYSTIVRKVGE